MLKIRVMGTKNDIKWFEKFLNRNPKVDVSDFSELFKNKGTDRFYRAYAEIRKPNINNGAEKKQQEEAKKLTDAPKTRTSLRAKLAQKRAEIAGNEQEKAWDKAKKNQRGDRVQ